MTASIGSSTWSWSTSGSNFRQNWQQQTGLTDTALDPTGNWTEFSQDDNGGDGTWELKELKQKGAHNDANEVTDIDKAVGTEWTTPTYDPAGNTTSFPQPVVLGLARLSKRPEVPT